MHAPHGTTYPRHSPRAYIGTLFMVTTSEAHDIVVKLLDKHFGKPLPTALWSAQNEIYGDGIRRPYVMTGVYPQRLRVSPGDMPRYIAPRLAQALVAWRRHLRKADPTDEHKTRRLKEHVDFHERELRSI